MRNKIKYVLISKLLFNLDLYKFMGISTFIPIQCLLFLRDVHT